MSRQICHSMLKSTFQVTLLHFYTRSAQSTFRFYIFIILQWIYFLSLIFWQRIHFFQYLLLCRITLIFFLLSFSFIFVFACRRMLPMRLPAFVTRAFWKNVLPPRTVRRCICRALLKFQRCWGKSRCVGIIIQRSEDGEYIKYFFLFYLELEIKTNF